MVQLLCIRSLLCSPISCAAASQALDSLACRRRVLLSGTPIQARDALACAHRNTADAALLLRSAEPPG
jgi:hypothetical protein